MTKIHPEAVALLNKHRGTTFRPGGEHYVENLTATQALSQALFERDDARAKVSRLTTLLDQQLGHPCEQIRHGYEVETLRAQVAEMREVIKDAMGELYDASHSCGDPNNEKNMDAYAVSYRACKNILSRGNEAALAAVSEQEEIDDGELEGIWDEAIEAAQMGGPSSNPYPQDSKRAEAWSNAFNQAYFKENH